MQQSYHIYAVKDARGDISWAVVDEYSDSIQLWGVDAQGVNWCFEDESWYLEGWAIKHGFEYRYVQQFFDAEAMFALA